MTSDKSTTDNAGQTDGSTEQAAEDTTGDTVEQDECSCDNLQKQSAVCGRDTGNIVVALYECEDCGAEILK